MGETFCFPLKQHIGAQAAPTIVKGDTVVRGQLIAYKEENCLGANIYSSVSGVVTEVTDNSILIEADEGQDKSYKKLTATEPLALIEEAGIVGLGGAGFPTYAKLSKPFTDDGVVIVNAAECEPVLNHNIRAIEENPAQLVRGLEITMDVVNAKRGIIAIKKIHTKAVEKLQNILKDRPDSDIEIHLLENMYPMGEERAIIRECLGKLLGVQSLPLEAGAIVINAETVCRIEEAVDLKKPFIDKNMTVAGKLKGNSNLIQVFFDVPLGISVGAMFEKAGGLSEDYGELIMGGPFTGKRTNIDKPVIKTTGGLIAAECFPKGPEKIGILVCACGANKERLEEIAKSLGSEVVGCEYCKQAKPVKDTRKCENPGKCPGQVQKVMALKKAGAQAVLISNCTDCSNTVMSCAPQLKLPVYHCTDGALRAVNEKLVRKIKS
ncbi:MAG: proline reductase-associated electron transfer protein PrdC [Agathobacter sp.]|uniref:proline reductase-associated electron transfer protein PrdC n=1 Tax=Agathobacter sp. TaxID=2021311 RepID=UPI002E789B31|nr:proline reductase-associated electron transfer protein PrdC [Agathobacter sp.]MEE1217607.1 proline reductase-associated electron transfer protein PrdC [Agathobacter sp.]